MNTRLKQLLCSVTIILACTVGVPASAGTCDVSEWSTSTTLTADRLNQRIRQTEKCINGELGDANIKSTEPLGITKLQNPNALYSVSFTIGDEDLDATAGEPIFGSLANGNNMRSWRVPVTSTVTGMSVSLRCTAGSCGASSATVTLQSDAATIKSFTGLATQSTPSVDFALSTSVANTAVLNLDIGGTLTEVEFIDVVVYFEAPHQT